MCLHLMPLPLLHSAGITTCRCCKVASGQLCLTFEPSGQGFWQPPLQYINNISQKTNLWKQWRIFFFLYRRVLSGLLPYISGSCRYIDVKLNIPVIFGLLLYASISADRQNYYLKADSRENETNKTNEKSLWLWWSFQCLKMYGVTSQLDNN